MKIKSVSSIPVFFLVTVAVVVFCAPFALFGGVNPVVLTWFGIIAIASCFLGAHLGERWTRGSTSENQE
ncbi:MAG: hypothetical protein OXL38_15455 [Gammaproteobacteria bacterium]|nr:hypothetical protein [Gammaproteobacteria bacterium]